MPLIMSKMTYPHCLVQVHSRNKLHSPSSQGVLTRPEFKRKVQKRLWHLGLCCVVCHYQDLTFFWISAQTFICFSDSVVMLDPCIGQLLNKNEVDKVTMKWDELFSRQVVLYDQFYAS